MSINTSFHFPEIPTVQAQDFPNAKNPFTCIVLTDDVGQQHLLYFPLGTRLTISAPEEA
jgi:hypothetical protein